jgi:hypothetical protein
MTKSMRSAQNLWAPDVGNAAAITLIAACGLYIFRWVFSPESTFFNDDWHWLRRAVFSDWSTMLSIWTFLPAALFADRPVEEAGIRLLYQIFELDHTGYAVAMLAIHIANAVLFYLLAARLLSSRFYALIAGVLFVIDHSVAYPAWWVSTLADSASLFFCLCAFLAFVSRRAYSSVLTVLFYYLAVKSKEASLPFPWLLFLYSFLAHVASARLSAVGNALKGALRSTWPVLAAFFVLFGFSMYYFVAARKAGMEAYGPYVPQFDLTTLIDSAGFYLVYIAFNLISPNQALTGFSILTLIAILTFNRSAILGSAGFFVCTSPVLFLPNQRAAYYAYAACAFIALMLVALLQRGETWLAEKRGVVFDLVAKAAVLVIAIWFTGFVEGRVMERDWTLAIMRENAKVLKTLPSLLSPVENKTNIVVLGLPKDINSVLRNSPCIAPKVIFKIWEIDCGFEGTDAELTAMYEGLTGPKILLHYDHGDVVLLARSP